MLLYNHRRGEKEKKGSKTMKKKLMPSFKKQFVGMSKKEAMQLLNESKEEYNIYAVDYYESGHQVPQVIYVNYGDFTMHFDKHTRRIAVAH